jgi:hypothetical protein
MIPALSLSLKWGDRLATHEVSARLGAGGVGEVYGARDLKLGPEMAIKTDVEPLIVIVNWPGLIKR